MKCAETTTRELLPNAAQEHSDVAEGVIQFPAGLLGFEKVKQYQLLGSPEEAPFLWLQMVEEPRLAFLVISPAMVVENYQPDISPEDVEFLGLQSPQEALVFNIVTTHPDESATINLKGPIVVNRAAMVGKQVIPLNSTNYPLQHPLPVSAA